MSRHSAVLQRPEHGLKTLLRLLTYLGRNRHLLIFGLLLTMVSAVSMAISNAFLKPIVNALLEPGGFPTFVRFLLIMAGTFLVGALFTYLGSRLLVQLSQRTSFLLRKELFEHLQDLPISFYDTHQHGDLMSVFTNDLDNISQALEQTLANFLSSTLEILATFIMMLVLSPLLTLVIVVMMFIIMLIIRWIGGISRRNFQRQQASLGSINGYIEEMMDGQKVVKVFHHEEEAKERFAELNQELQSAAKNAQQFSVILMPIMGNLSYIQYALTAILGAGMIIRGTLDIGSVAAFLQYSRSFNRPISQIANQMNLLIAALAGAERVFRLMDAPPERDEGDVTLTTAAEAGASCGPHEKGWFWKLPQADGSVQFVKVLGDIRLNDVNFSYVPGHPVLKGISLYAKPGQRIALVGSTGAGKTTITNLINHFYDIDSGSISYDGIDIRRIRKADLRRTLGMVLQDIHLFEGTIRENIRFGKLEATDEEIEAAARVANAHSFIRHLPQGYDTVLRAEGSNLSQGQRQLLSIARAAVADPVILVLDEATSSVDTRTERQIQIGMDKLMEGRTTFSIAHRLSTVRHANAIMVLEHGEIVERGDHDDLMSQKGRYYELNTGTLELS